VAGAPSAPALADGQWHGPGQYAVSSTASDNTGVRERRVLLEGYEVGRRTAPGAADDGCGQVNQGLAYTHVKPCEGTRGVNGALTTTITIPAGDGRLDGTGELVATAQDTGGTSVVSSALSVKVDTTAPSPPGVSGDPAWSAAQAGVVASTVAAESDRAPIVAADVERCGASTGCVTSRVAGGAFGATLDHALPALEEGATTLRVRHIDGAGNVGAWSGPVTLRRDRTAPAVTFWPVPGEVAKGNQLAFYASATDAGAGQARVDSEYQVDGGAWLPYDGPLTAAAGRTYRFRARATDAAGNRSEWVMSGSAAGVDPESGLAAPAPLPALPPAAAKRAADLVIRAAKLERDKLTVRAARAAAAGGPVAVVFTASKGGRTRTIRTTITPKRAVFTASLPLPAALRGVRHGKVVLRYGGDDRHQPGTASRRVAR
jgi:hypothetical protein